MGRHSLGLAAACWQFSAMGESRGKMIAASGLLLRPHDESAPSLRGLVCGGRMCAREKHLSCATFAVHCSLFAVRCSLFAEDSLRRASRSTDSLRQV